MGVTLELSRWLPAVEPLPHSSPQPAELQACSSGQASVSGMHVEGLGTFICPLVPVLFSRPFWKAGDYATALMDREQGGADVAPAQSSRPWLLCACSVCYC